MFNAVGKKTLYYFGASNIITFPMVWALYPESNQCTGGNGSPIRCGQAVGLGSEKNFARLTEQHPELVTAVRSGSSVVDPESGVGGTRMGVWQ